MTNVAYKEKKVLYGTLIMLFIILILLGVCIWRIFYFSQYTIMVKAVIIGLLAIGLYYLYLEIKNLIIYLGTNKILIKKDEEYLYLTSFKKTDKVNIKDIFRIDIGNIYNMNILFFQNSIIIRTKEKFYVVKNITNLDEAYDNLNKLIANKNEESL